MWMIPSFSAARRAIVAATRHERTRSLIRTLKDLQLLWVRTLTTEHARA